MSSENEIRKMLEKEDALKAHLKELRQDVKEALESSQLYKNVLETTMNGEYKVTEKAARTHALKVARDSYAPEKTDA
jgi:hypothetical protein